MRQLTLTEKEVLFLRSMLEFTGVVDKETGMLSNRITTTEAKTLAEKAVDFFVAKGTLDDTYKVSCRYCKRSDTPADSDVCYDCSNL